MLQQALTTQPAFLVSTPCQPPIFPHPHLTTTPAARVAGYVSCGSLRGNIGPNLAISRKRPAAVYDGFGKKRRDISGTLYDGEPCMKTCFAIRRSRSSTYTFRQRGAPCPAPDTQPSKRESGKARPPGKDGPSRFACHVMTRHCTSLCGCESHILSVRGRQRGFSGAWKTASGLTEVIGRKNKSTRPWRWSRAAGPARPPIATHCNPPMCETRQRPSRRHWDYRSSASPERFRTHFTILFAEAFGSNCKPSLAQQVLPKTCDLVRSRMYCSRIAKHRGEMVCNPVARRSGGSIR